MSPNEGVALAASSLGFHATSRCSVFAAMPAFCHCAPVGVKVERANVRCSSSQNFGASTFDATVYVPRALTRTRKTKTQLPCPRLGRRSGSARRKPPRPPAARPQTLAGEISIRRRHPIPGGFQFQVQPAKLFSGLLGNGSRALAIRYDHLTPDDRKLICQLREAKNLETPRQGWEERLRSRGRKRSDTLLASLSWRRSRSLVG
jgi:hypothetical protein